MGRVGTWVGRVIGVGVTVGLQFEFAQGLSEGELSIAICATEFMTLPLEELYADVFSRTVLGSGIG